MVIALVSTVLVQTPEVTKSTAIKIKGVHIDIGDHGGRQPVISKNREVD